MQYETLQHLKKLAANPPEQSFPRKWTHQVGNPLIGTIRDFSSFHHARYGLQQTVIVELETGELVSAILNAYLQESVRRKNAKVGDDVLIQLLGSGTSNAGNEYNRFQFEVSRPLE